MKHIKSETLQEIYDYWVAEYPQQRIPLSMMGTLVNKFLDVNSKELNDLELKRTELERQIVIPTFILLDPNEEKSFITEDDIKWINDQTIEFDRDYDEVEDMYMIVHTELTDAKLNEAIPAEEFIAVLRGSVLGKLQSK